MRILVIGILYIIYMLAGCPLWLSGGIPVWQRALIYSFFHANLFHLAANAVSIWFIYDPRRKRNGLNLSLAYLIAIIVYPLSTVPAVGFSNILYAALGLRTPALSSPWWRQSNTIVLLLVMVAMLAVPRVSAVTHMAAFFLGAVGAAIGRTIQPFVKDAGVFIGR